MTRNQWDTCAIVGVGETEMGHIPGASSFDLHVRAAKAALDDAGLQKSDIDGLLTVGSLVESWPHHSGALCEVMGLAPAYTDTVVQGGAGSCTMIQYAGMLIMSGVCEVVLCLGADNQLSGMTRDQAIQSFAKNRHPLYEFPLGLSTPAGYALIAQRHFNEYGTTREHLARVAVACRNHAVKNPSAQLRTPLTMADALGSKPIATPLHLTDCCLSSDGGGAVIVASAFRAKDLRRPPVHLLGVGQGFSHEHISKAPSLFSPGMARSGATAFRSAGLRPDDIDVALLYDCFTITVLMQIEAYGFCEIGESGPYVASGAIELDGALPVNTNGGMLAYGNPGIPGGLFHVIEAVRQLRGECQGRQVKDARTALVGGIGAVMSHASTLILGRT